MMRLGRSAWVAASMALLAGGYAAGIATAPAPAEAQGADVIDLDVYTRLDALEVRVTGLEDEAARPRNVITAPLRVVDAAGAELASIARGESNLPELKLGTGIVLGYAENEPRMSIFNGNRVAGVHLLDGGATVYASSDGIDGFFAGHHSEHGNSARIYNGGERVADLGAPAGRNAGLRFFTGGTLVSGIGIANTGNGLVVTNQADGTAAVTVGGDGAGHAAVDVHQGGRLAASINTRDLGGTGLVAVFNSGGSGVAYLSEGSGGGIFSATDAGGNEVFGAGFDGTSGVACIRRPNGNQYCLEPTLPLSRQE